MSINPVDRDGPFQLTLANPNIKFRSSKQGNKFTVEFEITQEDWQNFVDTNLTGMVIEADCRVTHRNYTDDMIAGLKGGKLSRIAAISSADPEFQEFALDHHKLPVMEEGDTDFAKALIYNYCGIRSRKELDDGPRRHEAAELLAKLRTEFIRGKLA